jgi:hypothetical protein
VAPVSKISPGIPHFLPDGPELELAPTTLSVVVKLRSREKQTNQVRRPREDLDLSQPSYPDGQSNILSPQNGEKRLHNESPVPPQPE